MQHEVELIWRRIGGALALLLIFGGGFGWYIASADAAVGAITISSNLGTTAACNATGAEAAAVYQGGRVQVFYDTFSKSWPIVTDITFPDGRVFVISQAETLLDGVIDMPNDFLVQDLLYPNAGGSAALVLKVPGTWPYGCYTISGTQPTIGRRATNSFVVVPGGGPAQNRGPASFSVTLRNSSANSGVQGSTVELYGSGFPGNDLVSIWITAPDGTVLDYPAQLPTSPAGNFTSAFTFGGQNPIGTYVFTAYSSTEGLRLFSPFTLNSPPVRERGVADLRVSVPYDATSPQRSFFQIQGVRYDPNEQIVVWMTLPDGAVRTFDSNPIFADQAGEFVAEFYLDERLPTGYYQVTAKGVTSQQIAIIGFSVEQNSGTAPTDPAGLVDVPLQVTP